MTKSLVLFAKIQTPPMSRAVRREAGFLLRQVQDGEQLGFRASRPMPTIGKRCLELRVAERGVTWRIIIHVASDEIVVLDVFKKKTKRTPQSVIDRCRERLKQYRK